MSGNKFVVEVVLLDSISLNRLQSSCSLYNLLRGGDCLSQGKGGGLSFRKQKNGKDQLKVSA